ncbi:MAG: AAA family ATPase [Bacteroidales bacterium]|nr:AAA family ATPase [Bacteroidales bacterium]
MECAKKMAILLAVMQFLAATTGLIIGFIADSTAMWVYSLIGVVVSVTMGGITIRVIYTCDKEESGTVIDSDDNEGAEEASALSKASTMVSATISEEYYKLCKDTANSIYLFANRLDSNSALTERLEEIKSKETLQYYTNFNVNDLLFSLIMHDMALCYKKLGHETGEYRKEMLTMSMLKMLGMNETIDEYGEMRDLHANTLEACNLFIGLVDNLGDISTKDKDGFTMFTLLKEYAEDCISEYNVLLYRFSSLVAKADDTITEHEAQFLESIAKRDTNIKVDSTVAEGTESPTDKLEKLIGLGSVKEEVYKLRDYVKIMQMREEQGLKSASLSYHCVFTGNPGTGKTTIARILAGIYKDLGVVKGGQLVETDRSGLVAEYVGQTAPKTNAIIDKALDGILFIDEAYSLVQGSENDYGNEAIATLLKRMEDDRDRLIVILAGYDGEMQQFIDSNPGLQSRFNRYIHFNDYSADELLEIFSLNMRSHDYKMSDETKEYVRERLQEAVAKKDKNFGNGRFVRNVFEKTIEAQAVRLAREPKITKAKLQEIKAEDVRKAI